ncbi:two-component response regulator ARR14-like [Apium graveolens]|uniref:two-component response regulator ARR14-like n=1 Tax=Apium graveolens TaxID=4045 RepID=UPI003D78CB59
MYRVLVVDDDTTCLTISKACLMKLNYQVTAVTCPLQALSILGENGDNNERTPYDIVLADVHMPVMGGFELVRHIQKDFNIPVLLISSDNSSESVTKGFKIGASAYYLKPIKVEDLAQIWQYIKLWKNNKIDAGRPSPQATIPTSICFSSANTIEDEQSEKKTRTDWTPNLHTRFVEAMLILGSKRAIPNSILKLMNVPGLSREQVGSHLQVIKNYRL